MRDSGKLSEIKRLAGKPWNEGDGQSHAQKVASICAKFNQEIVDDQREYISAGKHYRADLKDCIQ